jgi:hypothetical protein
LVHGGLLSVCLVNLIILGTADKLGATPPGDFSQMNGLDP